MQSPLDPRATLLREEIQPGLIGFRCPTSAGLWIDGEMYWDWLRQQPGFPKPTPESDANPTMIMPISENTTPMISPRSGRLMQKYRVGSGLGFQIDFDSISGGFWLDKDEYKTLASLNLHDELHLICSPEYQKKLASQRTGDIRKAQISAIIGPDGCERIEHFAAWIQAQKSTSTALAYLDACLDEKS